MLAVDWLGLVLTALLLTLLLSGQLRLARALLAMVLVELARLALVLVAGGHLAAWTVGGAFSRVEGAAFSVPFYREPGMPSGSSWGGSCPGNWPVTCRFTPCWLWGQRSFYGRCSL